MFGSFVGALISLSLAAREFDCFIYDLKEMATNFALYEHYLTLLDCSLNIVKVYW